MAILEGDRIRALLGGVTRTRLEQLEIFTEIDSTNSYLMQQLRPQPGCIHVAATMNQTAGRGRYGKTWLSPPGSGLCVSLAYTFVRKPDNLSALTLAIGLGAIKALQACGVEGVMLKWPNDLVMGGGKLGGILTETHAHSAKELSVVTGIGVNIEISAGVERELGPDRALPVANLRAFDMELPTHDQMTAHLVKAIYATFAEFEACGFAPFYRRWRSYDWLYGRDVLVDAQHQQFTGIAAGIDEDGALLIDRKNAARQRVTSGSVLAVTKSADTE